MTDDPRWPRASTWLQKSLDTVPHLVLLGVPAHLTSLSPTRAHTTPAAVRAALSRYSLWVESAGIDLADLTAADLGDIEDPDTPEGVRATQEAVAAFPDTPVIAIGGDNSITFAVATGAKADGLVTLDAHFDLRDGVSNGSPVRRLVESGLSGRRVVQVGIADFSNSAEYAARARDYGITVVSRDTLRRRPVSDIMAEALEIAGSGAAARVHVDFDVDVCDRGTAPACPASAPGGISADELRTAARIAGSDPRVVSVDIAEVDAAADTPDQRTVRLAATCVLEAAAGVAMRL